MYVVRALVSGPWRSVDLIDGMGTKIGDKSLVQSFEMGKWSVDNRAVDVEPGLCVSFRDEVDAGFFLNNRRAGYVVVEPDTIVPFESESDALFFVNRGLGEMLSQREVDEILEEMRRRQGEQDAESKDGEQGGDDDADSADVEQPTTAVGKQSTAKGSRTKVRRR